MIRQLLYNCCPMESGSTIWRANIAWLNKYKGAFNNRKLVIVRTGEGMEPLSAVQQSFEFDVEFMELPNDPVIGESAGFISALEKFSSMRRDEVIFYAHTKGVSHPSRNEDPAILRCVERWRDYLYHYCLHDIAAVELALRRYSACGCLLSGVPGQPSKWMFVGSFWWARCSSIFSNPKWREIGGWQGTELYLSNLFPIDRACDLSPEPLIAQGYQPYYDMLPEIEE